MRRAIRNLLRGIVYLIVLLLCLFGLVLGSLETRWGKNQLRALMVRQANQYLTATLEITDLKGSILRGLELYGVRLARDHHTIVSIDQVALSYSIRELTQPGTVIQRIRLVHPQVVAQKQPDGRWNLAALVKREVRQNEQTGPRRPIEIQAIEVVDGTVVLKDPLVYGAAHVPGRYERLNLSLSYKYEPVSWRLDFAHASWLGGASDLAVDRLTGALGNGAAGWFFDNLAVRTSQSAFTLNGRIERGHGPSQLNLHVAAERFVFQEWGTVLPALARMPIDSNFDVQLTGPLTALTTALDLHSNGGAAQGTLVLDTTVPGWHGTGGLDLRQLDLAPWFNNIERRSDITGRATFNVDLRLGRGVPIGTYVFEGTHAAYAGYAADRIRLHGDITERDWRIAGGTAVAYGANVSLSSGTIALGSPYPFHFAGAASAVDLRSLPPTIPVPHVDSLLAFDYDTTGQFVLPYIAGRARFDASEFIGAEVAAGTVGAIDTATSPIHYTGEGDVVGIDLNRFGRTLDVAWLQDPRYAGTVAGHFHADGFGTVAASMRLSGGGRLTRADLFSGQLTDAEVALEIDAGSLRGSYDGQFSRINPAIAFADDRFAAALSGSGKVDIVAPDLMVRTLSLSDYRVLSNLVLSRSEARAIVVDRATGDVSLSNGALTFSGLRASGPLFDLQGDGTVALGAGESRFDYEVSRADLALLEDRLGAISGDITTKGRLSGPSSAVRLAGDATVNRLNASGVQALTTTGHYDATFPIDAPERGTAQVTGQASFVDAFGQALKEVAGTVVYEQDRLTADLSLAREDGLAGTVAGTAVFRPEGRALDLANLTVSIGGVGWRMLTSTPPAIVRWNDAELSVTPVAFVDARIGDQRIEFAGTWRQAGDGAFHIKATRVSLDTLSSTPNQPSTYGGLIDLDATLSGTRDHPVVRGDITLTEGRVRRLSYEKLAGRIGYADGALQLDLRLDQAPGIWLTAAGTMPPTLFNRDAAEQPVDLTLVSSDISLGLIEGITAFVSNVSGQLRANLRITGTNRTPAFDGSVELTGTGFQLASTGARYKNGSARLELGADRINVSAFHLEDRNGRPLEVRGSLGTRELRVGDLAVDIRAKGFEVMRNELGTVQVDASLTLRGQFDTPRLVGDVAIVGGELKVDEVLSRALFPPYATQPIQADVANDVIAALNPWDRLFLDVAVHSQSALRLTGENVVAENAPLGLGSFDLRASGDVFLYKEPGQMVAITGSLDSISGSYSFQGRRFELYPSSSVDFRGDLNPGIFITVYRIISGVETRVTISGSLREPELQLSSAPPLDPSDVLSLIVFNTSANDLSAEQQRELAVRAGTLAVGFLANSLTTALERSIGLDLLEIEPATGINGGAKVTVGEEIAPGLVARFSRQFGADQYDEAAIEYIISRILRLRATFSDASTTLIERSPFRRVERAGIDLLLFFSF